MLSYSGSTNSCESYGYEGSVYYPDGSEQSGLDVPELDTIGVTEDCTWTDFYTATWTTVAEGGPDPGPPESGGNNPDAPDTTPVDSFPIDTCAISNDPVGAVRHFPMLDSMNAALDESVSNDTEIAFYITYDATAHQFHFHRWPTAYTVADSTDNCNFVGHGGFSLDFTLVAEGHTHPYHDNDFVTCRISGDTGHVKIADNGGGSEADWDQVESSGVAQYTVDRDNIWLLPTDLSYATREDNTHEWVREPNGSCPLN